MTDSILALTKSSPVPVGPGTRRKAKHFQPPAVRSGFRPKKSTGTKAVPLKKQDSTDIFSSLYDTLYGSPYGSVMDADRMISLWRNSDEVSTVDTKPALQFVDYEEGPLGSLPWPQPNPLYYSTDFITAVNSLRTSASLPPQSLENTNVNKLMRFPMPDPAKESDDKGEYDPEHHTDYRTANYLHKFIVPKELKERVQAVVDALAPELDKFDSIAFTGMSGALIGPPVALALSKEVIMVRKQGHGSHSSYEVEGNYGSRRYIMIDDGRSSGRTEEHIITSIKRVMPKAEYVGFMSALFAEQYGAEREEWGTAIRPAMSKAHRPDRF